MPTKISHHRNFSVLFLTQNLFYKSKQQNHRSKCTIFGSIKNGRDSTQIENLARQRLPGKSSFMLEAFADTTAIPFGWPICWSILDQIPMQGVQNKNKYISWQIHYGTYVLENNYIQLYITTIDHSLTKEVDLPRKSRLQLVKDAIDNVRKSISTNCYYKNLWHCICEFAKNLSKGMFLWVQALHSTPRAGNRAVKNRARKSAPLIPAGTSLQRQS